MLAIANSCFLSFVETFSKGSVTGRWPAVRSRKAAARVGAPSPGRGWRRRGSVWNESSPPIGGRRPPESWVSLSLQCWFAVESPGCKGSPYRTGRNSFHPSELILGANTWRHRRQTAPFTRRVPFHPKTPGNASESSMKNAPTRSHGQRRSAADGWVLFAWHRVLTASNLCSLLTRIDVTFVRLLMRIISLLS